MSVVCVLFSIPVAMVKRIYIFIFGTFLLQNENMAIVIEAADEEIALNFHEVTPDDCH